MRRRTEIRATGPLHRDSSCDFGRIATNRGATATGNGRATLSLPHLDPNFNCSYSFWRVGQCSTIGGYEGRRQGNIHFAGEHTSVDFQGWMEGGAITCVRAAGEILADLK